MVRRQWSHESMGEDNRMNNYKHGLYKNMHYPVYIDMVHRCYNTKHKSYLDYGERGITICKEWLGEKWHGYGETDWLQVDGLKTFLKWCKLHVSSGEYLDRKENDREYSPENCRGVNITLSNLNRRPHKRKHNLPRGVYPSKNGNRYISYIKKGKKLFSLGTYDTVEEASQMYNNDRQKWVKENTP